MGCNRFPRQLAIAAIAVLALAGSAGAAIVIDGTQQFSVASGNGLNAVTGLGAFDAAGADKLVVLVSTEHAFNNAHGHVSDVQYNGVSLTEIVQADGGAGVHRGTAAIFYLDSPGPVGTGISISAANPNGGLGAAYALSGTLPAFGATSSALNSTSTSITTTAPNSLVIATFNDSGDPDEGSNFAELPTATAPLTPVSSGTWGGGRRWGGHASGYEQVASAGTVTPSFTTTADNHEFSIAAAEFLAAGGPPPPTRPIADLFNTGVDGSGTPLADGMTGDPHYTITSVPGGTTDVRVRTSAGGFPIGPWLGDNSTSAWIGPNNASNLNSPAGDYTIETSFTVPGIADPSSVVISGEWATDNPGVDILLNGNSLLAAGHISSADLSGGFGSFTPFSFGPGVPFFQFGTNTLGFVFNNAPPSDNPAGLRVDNLAGSFEIGIIPEPSTLAIWSLGLLGLACCGRRRRVA